LTGSTFVLHPCCMPRGPRLDYPGALHHIIVRGIERRKIFYCEKDREAFLDRLEDVVLRTKAGLYAWALMPNHAHALLRTGELPISRLVQRWLGPYATTFNLVHRRAGHLFQNRNIALGSADLDMCPSVCASQSGRSVSRSSV
jgi:REP-associated tyrosine transposase